MPKIGSGEGRGIPEYLTGLRLPRGDLMKTKHRFLGVAVPLVGVVLCIAAVIGFISTIVNNNLRWTLANDVFFYFKINAADNFSPFIFGMLDPDSTTDHHQVGFGYQILHGVGLHRGSPCLPAMKCPRDNEQGDNTP